MKIVETELVLKPGMGRPFYYGSIAPADAHAMLQRKTKAALNAANPGGTRPTRARIELRSITIAEKVRGRPHYDSVIFAMVRFFDIASGAQVGEETRMGLQATYRPGFLGGYDRLLPPEQELALITTHSANVLAETVFK